MEETISRGTSFCAAIFHHVIYVKFAVNYLLQPNFIIITGDITLQLNSCLKPTKTSKECKLETALENEDRFDIFKKKTMRGIKSISYQ